MFVFKEIRNCGPLRTVLLVSRPLLLQCVVNVIKFAHPVYLYEQLYSVGDFSLWKCVAPIEMHYTEAFHIYQRSVNEKPNQSFCILISF